MVKDNVLIGGRLRSAREAKGFTQSELAKSLSSSKTSTAISQYEKGVRGISVSMLSEFASILDTSFEYLATGQSDKETPIQVALRADKKLKDNSKAVNQIMDYIDLVKIRVNKEID